MTEFVVQRCVSALFSDRDQYRFPLSVMGRRFEHQADSRAGPIYIEDWIVGQYRAKTAFELDQALVLLHDACPQRRCDIVAGMVHSGQIQQSVDGRDIGRIGRDADIPQDDVAHVHARDLARPREIRIAIGHRTYKPSQHAAVALHFSRLRQLRANIVESQDEAQVIEWHFGKAMYPREIGVTLLRAIVQSDDLPPDRDWLLRKRCGDIATDGLDGCKTDGNQPSTDAC